MVIFKCKMGESQAGTCDDIIYTTGLETCLCLIVLGHPATDGGSNKFMAHVSEGTLNDPDWRPQVTTFCNLVRAALADGLTIRHGLIITPTDTRGFYDDPDNEGEWEEKTEFVGGVRDFFEQELLDEHNLGADVSWELLRDGGRGLKVKIDEAGTVYITRGEKEGDDETEDDEDEGDDEEHEEGDEDEDSDDNCDDDDDGNEEDES